MTTPIDPLYKLLFDWANQILNTEESLGIEVEESNQNASKHSVKDTFIVIDYARVSGRINYASFGNTNASGERQIKNNYEGTITIFEVNGNGSLLKKLIETKDRQDIIDLFNSRGFAYISEGPVTPVPRLPDQIWRRESMVQLLIRSASEITEDAGYIEHSEIEGTVPAQGRSGDHIIDNTI